jgi:hypothetical protein
VKGRAKIKVITEYCGHVVALGHVQVKLVGKERLVLDLSCRQRDGQYYVVTDRWQRFSSLSLSEASLASLAASCDEFLVHGVDVEGMQLGIDVKLVELLGECSPIPVTYAGGARTLVRRWCGIVGACDMRKRKWQGPPYTAEYCKAEGICICWPDGTVGQLFVGGTHP